MKPTDKIFKALAGMATGKSNGGSNFWLDAGKKIFEMSGMERQVTQWMLVAALSNPNIRTTLYKVRTHVSADNAVHVGDFACTVMVEGDNRTGQLVGLVALGVVGNFEISDSKRAEYRMAAAKLKRSRDAVIKDVAVMICDALAGETSQEGAAANAKLLDQGIDIKKAIEKEA